jgi:hypothetical protein
VKWCGEGCTAPVVAAERATPAPPAASIGARSAHGALHASGSAHSAVGNWGTAGAEGGWWVSNAYTHTRATGPACALVGVCACVAVCVCRCKHARAACPGLVCARTRRHQWCSSLVLGLGARSQANNATGCTPAPPASPTACPPARYEIRVGPGIYRQCSSKVPALHRLPAHPRVPTANQLQGCGSPRTTLPASVALATVERNQTAGCPATTRLAPYQAGRGHTQQANSSIDVAPHAQGPVLSTPPSSPSFKHAVSAISRAQSAWNPTCIPRAIWGHQPGYPGSRTSH